jgi:hypothetical protein
VIDAHYGKAKSRKLYNSLVRRSPQSSNITKVVVTVNWVDSEGIGVIYGRDLGVALLQNSSVTSLSLCVRGLLDTRDEETSDDVRPLLDYIATSKTLTAVAFSHARKRDTGVLARRLLDAAAMNSNIIEVTASEHICPSPETLIHFLTTARSIRKMSVGVGWRDSSSSTREMLASAIGKYHTLQDLELASRGSFGTEMLELILSELATNSNHLRVLRFYNANDEASICQFQGLSRLLCNTQALSHICFSKFKFEKDSMKVLLTALESNQTVTCLMFLDCTIMAEKTANMFTKFLRSSSSRIQELRFRPAVPERFGTNHPRFSRYHG